jgi:hydroxypyruvate isomerase
MNLRFSANLGFLWPDRPLLDRIDAAAKAGFRAIELHWPYDTDAALVGAACRRNGLTLLSINTPPGDQIGDFGLGAVAGREADFIAGLELAIAYARAAGGASLHIMAGVVQAGEREAGTALFIRRLKLAARLAPDLTLLLEPINQRDKPGYFYSTLAVAEEITSKVGATNIGIMFDAYHVGVSEGDVEARLERSLPLIRHIQFAAVPSRAEPDEGELDYRSFFSKLESLGYAGWVGAEYKPRADTDDGLAWVGALGLSL